MCNDNVFFTKYLIKLITLTLLWCCSLHITLASTAIATQTEQLLDDYLELIVDNQPDAITRLEQILAQLPQDVPISTKVRAFSYHIRNHLMYQQTDLALQQAEHLLQLAYAAGLQDAITEALLTQFNVLMYIQEQHAMPQSPRLNIIKLATELNQQLTQTRDARIRYVGHILLAEMYMHQQSDYETALTHYYSAYDIIQKTADNQTVRRTIHLLEHIGRMHLSLNNPALAYPYISQAIDIAIRHNIQRRLALLYLLKGYTEEQLQQPEQELASLQTGLVWAEKMQEQNTAISIMHNIGLYYQQKKLYDKAAAILNEALRKSAALHDTYNTNNIMMSLGIVQVKSGNQQQGIVLIEQSLPYFRQTLDQAALHDVLGEVANSYQQAGLFKQQADTLLEQSQLTEALFHTGQDERIQALQKQFDTSQLAQKERQLEQENANTASQTEYKSLQHKFMPLLVIAILCITLLLWLLCRRRRFWHSKR
ncbi:MAG: hypothetical protein COW15_18550 [Shewanella sp. CG12_big_fil_rev_8_21_14_0_65_47_15]|nr:MAG: hypothetical protein COW15_18550 [Shewanella sp. CG12_big_fil_rev_8_21_14_0_65_47_15]